MERIYGADMEFVMHDHLDCLGNPPWGDLYRIPIYRGVPACESFYDGYELREFTAPEGDGTYTLYVYVQGSTFQRYGWERE